MRGKTTVFPVEPVNNFSASFKVSLPFTYGPGVQLILLTSTEPPVGALAVVIGCRTPSFGGLLPSPILAVQVYPYIISRAECNRAYAAYGGITVNMICPGVPGGGKSCCQGDSGDPLVVGGQLAGIVSWGLSCALADFLTVYSNVATLKCFITEQTGVQ